jgi:hypothetical protein
MFDPEGGSWGIFLVVVIPFALMIDETGINSTVRSLGKAGYAIGLIVGSGMFARCAAIILNIEFVERTKIL